MPHVAEAGARSCGIKRKLDLAGTSKCHSSSGCTRKALAEKVEDLSKQIGNKGVDIRDSVMRSRDICSSFSSNKREGSREVIMFHDREFLPFAREK